MENLRLVFSLLKISIVTLVIALLMLTAPSSTSAQLAQPDLDALPPCAFTQTAASDIPGLQVGAVIVDLATSEGCAENLDQPMHIASVPKLFIAGAFLLEVARGNLSFDTTMAFSADYYMGGRNACLDGNVIGQRFTYGYLSDIMISCSDNSATWMLMDVVGWDTVQAYIDSLGIPGIGTVIPYSEVDRLKLTHLDARWENVPRGLASQYMRMRNTGGLVPRYFASAPDYSREQRIEASAYYFANYSYNTATPRAIAQYILKLRDDLQRPGTPEWNAAYWLFNTMILTQRQFSTQAFPGTVFIGAKNGFDTGLRAEVNVVFPVLYTLEPAVIALVFTQQTDVGERDFDQLGPTSSTTLTDYLTGLSPRIVGVLNMTTERPSLSPDTMLATLVVNYETPIRNCTGNESLFDIENCWLSLLPPNFRVGNVIGTGMIFRNLVQQTHRLTFIYTAPDGRRFSYQWTVAERDQTHVFWFHTSDMAGTWRIDIYKNLQRIRAEEFVVGE